MSITSIISLARQIAQTTMIIIALIIGSGAVATTVVPSTTFADDPAPGAGTGTGTSGTGSNVVTTVICNIIKFVRGIGLPIMTGVILGSSIMAIFGRMPWPAIVTLVVFTAIFFGADQVIKTFSNGIQINGSSASSFSCDSTASS